MFAAREELLEKIRLGEDTYLELKEVRFSGGRVRWPDQRELSDEIAAFANGHGGVILMGVKDDPREVSGIPVDRLDGVEELIRQACEDSTTPPLAPVIERITLPDSFGSEQPVIRISISSSLAVHRSSNGYFHRIGSSKRAIPPDQLARLFQQRSQARLIRFDEMPVKSATLDDLDEQLWSRFLGNATGEPSIQVLVKLGMAVRDEGAGWHPTVAGLLLACRNPKQFIPGAFIQAVSYFGTRIEPRSEGAYQRDAQDISGPLDWQIFEACDFVRKNTRLAATKNSEGGRVDIPQFHPLVVFEAIANAVAHRDYSMTGSKVRLRLFDDRLEIFTPGSLPNTMTPESLEYRQAVRNETISSLLARCPTGNDEIGSHRRFIMDRRGEGVPIILSKSVELSGRRPEYFMADDSELVLKVFSS